MKLRKQPLAIVCTAALVLTACEAKRPKNKNDAQGGGTEQPGSADEEPNSETPNSDSPGTDNSGSDQPSDNGDLFKDCQASPSSKFVAKLYRIPENSEKLPDFSTLSLVKETCLQQLDIAQRSFEEGFPGAGDLIEWFALDINFLVKIEQEGEYTFRLNSDDGSVMSIGDAKVIDNDGLHAPQSKEATVFMQAGQHKFRIQYFQGPRFDLALELFWKTPGREDESLLPLEIVSRP